MTGYCTVCQAEVAVSEDLRCPNCGSEIHPMSLPHARRASDPPRAVAVANALTPPSMVRAPVELPPVDDIVKWRRDTVWRRDRLIAREAELVEELRGVRIGRKALDQVLNAVTIQSDEVESDA